MERTGFIGGSDVPALLGVDPYRTTEQLYAEKAGLAIPIVPASNDIRRGLVQEPVAIRRLIEEHGGAIAGQQWEVGRDVLRGHVDLMWERADGVFPAEIKCPNRWRFERIVRSETTPLPWELQAHTYGWLTGAPQAYLAMYCADTDELELRTIPVDMALGQLIVERAAEFLAWVLARRPWDPDAWRIPEWVQAAPAEVQEQNATLTDVPALAGFAADYAEASDLVKAAEQARTASRAELLEALDVLAGEAPGRWRAGAYRVNRYAIAPRRTLDRTALEHARPLDRLAVWATLGTLREQHPEALDALVAVERALMGSDVTVDLGRYEKVSAAGTGLRVTRLDEPEGPTRD